MTGKAPEVTVFNYVRAETDLQMAGYIAKTGCFGTFVHNRDPYDVNNQVTVRAQRDTLYSFGAFDLTSPLTITMPDPGGRYQSFHVISEDHSMPVVGHGPGVLELTEEFVGTRYVFVIVRTFADPNDDADVAAAHTLQDLISAEQADTGNFEVPEWSSEDVSAMRNSIMVVSAAMPDSTKSFGNKDDLDPIYWLLGAAHGWGGLPVSESLYLNVVPESNDGVTPHTLTVGDVPVDGFWSVTLYDAEGWMPVNEHDAYAFNNVTAHRDPDGTVTIHFGGREDQANFLPIQPGWNYIVRLYQPHQEIIDGSWTFPSAVAVD